MRGVRAWFEEQYGWAVWYQLAYIIATVALLVAQATRQLDGHTSIVCYAMIVLMEVGIAGISYIDRWWSRLFDWHPVQGEEDYEEILG